MFSLNEDASSVICLADYKRIKRGAVVHRRNELYEDVEAWLSEGNHLAAFSGHPDTRTLSDAKADQLAKINDAYQAQMAATLSKYPEAETITFDKQDREARAYQAWVDNGETGAAPATPLVSNMAEGRQMAKEELVPRIIAKANAFTTESGHATGKRQYLEDRISSATTVDEVIAVNW
jgi:predicted nucleic acid-binding protein